MRCVERVVINPSIAPASITYWTGNISISATQDWHSAQVVVSLSNWFKWYSNTGTDGCVVPEPDFSGWTAQFTPKGTQPTDVSTVNTKNALFNAAVVANPTTFSYRTDVGNVYIVSGSHCGGYGMFPNNNHAGTNIFVLNGVGDISFFVHELGHFSNLEHTFATKEGTAGVTGDEKDPLSDTLPDVWDFGSAPLPEVIPAPARWNSLANRMYGIVTYSGLNAAARTQVKVMASIGDQNFGADNYTADELERIWQLWENIMSYHKGADPVSANWLLTDLQMDRWSDAYALMRPIASGRHWIFGGPMTNAGAPLGTSRRSHTNIVGAVSSANATGGDIVVGRPGSYPVPGPNGTSLRITKPLCIRATKAGQFSIYGH